MMRIEYACGEAVWVLGPQGIVGYQQELELSCCPDCGKGVRMTTVGSTFEQIKEARARFEYEQQQSTD